jgi:hypothetical protein
VRVEIARGPDWHPGFLMTELFHGPRLKIERAKEHINNLNRLIDLLAASGFYTLSIHSNPNSGDDVLQIEVFQLVPKNFAPVIGDALHNLKSALDLTVNEVVFSRLGYFDDHTRFPFRKTRDGVITAINGALIKQASPKVAEFIVDSVKPYSGGNDPLWALHDLNILDKHRLLLPIVNVRVVHDICIEDEGHRQHVISPWALTGNRIATFELIGHKNSKITHKGTPTLLILFDQGLVWEGKPVVPSLHQLTELVSDIVGSIEAIFLNEKI